MKVKIVSIGLKKMPGLASPGIFIYTIYEKVLRRFIDCIVLNPTLCSAFKSKGMFQTSVQLDLPFCKFTCLRYPSFFFNTLWSYF